MKRLLPLLLALLLTACQSAPAPAETGLPSAPAEASGETDPLPPGSGEGSRPLQTANEETAVTVPETPETASFFLTRWNGEQGLQAFCYSPEDRAALAEALPEVRGYAVTEKRTVPEDPWPVYTLEIGGVEEDFLAAYAGGIWRDNQGNVLKADVDFDGLWELFKESAEPLSPDRSFNRELALAGGGWDARFLKEAEIQDPMSAMELVSSGDGLGWTFINRGGYEVLTGNSSTAMPQVLLAGKWYHVPMLTGKHYGWNDDGVIVRPGEDFSGTYWQEPFGTLPDGNYRLVLSYIWEEPLQTGRNSGIAAVPFSVRDGKLLPAEE